MIVGSIGRRYAKALIAIGIENRTFEGLGREVERLARAYAESEELRGALVNPIFQLGQRRKVLEEVCRRLAVSRTVHHFALLLLERGRIRYLPDIAREMRAMVDLQAGRLRARVTTARPLELAAEVRIKAALERQTGKSILLEKQQDPSLIGGVVTQLGDVLYDGSVRTQLDTIRKQLTEA